MAGGCKKFPTRYRLDCADVAAHVRAVAPVGDPHFQAKSGAAGVRTGDLFLADGFRAFPTLYRLDCADVAAQVRAPAPVGGLISRQPQ